VVLEQVEDPEPRPVREGAEHAIDAGCGLHAGIVRTQKGLASNDASTLRLFESGFPASVSV
jgi:hypothetical protein